MKPYPLVKLSLMLITLLASAPAFAQATRTWVSGVGDDANPCSRTAPCKTFAGAISKTAAGGEINVLDSGGFGAVTITKSITIDGAGAHASILASATTGIVVNAASPTVVNLRNLAINGAGGTPGINGIRVMTGGTVNIENVTVLGFSQFGLRYEPTTAAELSIVNSTFENNDTTGGGGILIKPGVGGAANATLTGVRVVNNATGLRVEPRSTVSVRDSTISGSTGVGALMLAVNQAGTMAIEGSQVSGNGVGLRAQGAASELFISNNIVNGNGTGLSTTDNGTLVSFGNNNVEGNGTDGVPTTTIATR